jgi:hypothetical protein
MKKWHCGFLSILMIFGLILPVKAQNDLSKIIVSTQPTKNEKELVQKSSLIVYGWFDSAEEEYPTNKKVDNGELVNFVQTLHVKRTYKGSPPQLVRVVSTGIEPLPDPSNPLNKTYPGPMAEGEYVCFLKSLPGTDVYYIVGGWQGVYPVYQGKTVSFEDFGYPQFEGLTLQELETKIKGE